MENKEHKSMTEKSTKIPELSDENGESDEIPSLGRFIFGSGPRIRIFREIQQGAHYSDLTESYSDSLVSSTVNDFRKKNLAYKTEQNAVRLTPLGEHISDSYSGLISDLKQFVRVDEFFDAAPPESYQLLDKRIIENGETISGNPVDKNAVIYDYVGFIRDADEIKEVQSITSD